MAIDLVSQSSFVVREGERVELPPGLRTGDMVLVHVIRGALPPDGFPLSRQQRRWQERQVRKATTRPETAP